MNKAPRHGCLFENDKCVDHANFQQSTHNVCCGNSKTYPAVSPFSTCQTIKHNSSQQKSKPLAMVNQSKEENRYKDVTMKAQVKEAQDGETVRNYATCISMGPQASIYTCTGAGSMQKTPYTMA